MELWKKWKIKQLTYRSLFVCVVHCYSNTTSEEYYRRTIFIPFIYSLIRQLNERFSGKTKSAISGIYLILSLIGNLDQRYLNTTNLTYQVSLAAVRKFKCGKEIGLTRKTFQQCFRELLNVLSRKR